MKEGLIRRTSQGAKTKRWVGVSASMAMVIGLMLSVPAATLADSPPRFSLPIDGDYFFSDTSKNVGVVGSFTISGFENEGNALTVTGVLEADLTTTGVDQSTLPPVIQDALTPEGTVLVLPVKIESASCNRITMELGPVPGLTEPITISHSGQNVSNACAIANAVRTDQTDLLVELLNETEGVGNLKGCSFLDAISCAGVAITCASACAVSPPFCIVCLASFGLVRCGPCVGL